MNKIILTVLMGLMTACGGFQANKGVPNPTVPMHNVPAIVQGEITFSLNTGMESVKYRHPMMNLLIDKAYAAGTQQAVASTTVTAVAAPGVTLTATFTPETPTIDVTTGQVKLGHFTITALNDNSVRKCGTAPNTTGTKQCNKAYIRLFTSNNGLLGDGDVPDTATALATVLGGTPTNINAATSLAPALLKTANISSNRFRLTNLGGDVTYELYADFSDVGDGSYSTTVTLQYAINKE